MAPSHICNYRRNIIKFTAKFNIFLFLSLLLLRLVSAQMDITTDVEASSCDGSYIMNGSALERNSNMVLNSLVENVGETGFNISWYGQNEDKMYGLAQCRGDMNAPTCEACASYAKRTFNEDCRRISGSIRLRGCFLRYATYNFYSKLTFTEHNAIECINTTNRTDANASGLDWSIANLLTKVINDAVSSEVGYATGNGNGIYAVAQCWRDLNMDQCRQCLNTWYKSFAHCPQGFIQGDDYNKNCVIHFATYKFYGDDVLLASPSKRATEGKSRPNLPILLGLTIPGVVIVLLLFGGVVIWKRKVSKPLHEKPVLGYHKSTKELSTAISKSKLNFKFQILQTATRSFDPTNKLGQGGFGSVYKGILPDGKEIAVKRLCDNREHSVNEFFNEVNLISCVQHKNLVKLFGFSIDGINRILVYEYLPNKSLDKFLFDGNMAKVLDWERRFEIILGIASGLAYLHQGSDIRIIHRDIKASNILLDQHFKPKIADFGLVRHFSEDQTHLSTAIVGTRGYMAPEYLMHGHLTEKVDVYAFGVLVLEIITGRKNRTRSYADEVPSLLTVVWNHYLSGTPTNIIDPNIKENSQENVLQVVHIALLCTQASANLRPSMSKVIMFLMNKTPNLPQPTQPPFIDVVHSQLITNPIAASSLQANTNTRAALKIRTPISNFASFPDTPLSLNTMSSTSFGPR